MHAPEPLENVTVHRDLPYVSCGSARGHLRQKLDLYLPQGAHPRPSSRQRRLLMVPSSQEQASSVPGGHTSPEVSHATRQHGHRARARARGRETALA